MSNSISLDETMAELRDKYKEANSSTKKVIDSLLDEIEDYAQHFIGEKEELLI